MVKVSIIILNYNGCIHTVACLASLAKIESVDYEVILYDNGSTDDTAEVVRKRFRNMRVVKIKKNIGYCRGTNDAYRYAKGKYVLLLNNDTIVTPRFLSTLVARMEADPATAIVQPKLIFHKTKKLQSGYTFLTTTGFLYYGGYGKDPSDIKYNNAIEMYSVNGACMLVRRTVVEKIGLFDEDFFLYFEETDFCHRALLAGYKIWYEPKATVYHIGSVDNSRYKYSLLVFMATKNRLCSYIKNLGSMYIITILPIHLFLCVVSIVAYLALGKSESAWSVIKALSYTARHMSDTLRKRRYIQRIIRKVSDSTFLPHLMKNPRPEYYLRLLTGLEAFQD